jgi:hypothetical protein
LLTTQEIALAHNVTPRRILALAKRRGVVPVRTIGRSRLWARSAMSKLKPGKVGRPRTV